MRKFLISAKVCAGAIGWVIGVTLWDICCDIGGAYRAIIDGLGGRRGPLS